VEAGEALFGPRWQSELARELDVADRTVRRWVAGDAEMPRGVYTDLLRLTQERAAALDALADRLREMG
jgi:DNA-binding transcriptional regulator YiaG